MFIHFLLASRSPMFNIRILMLLVYGQEIDFGLQRMLVRYLHYYYAICASKAISQEPHIEHKMCIDICMKQGILILHCPIIVR